MSILFYLFYFLVIIILILFIICFIHIINRLCVLCAVDLSATIDGVEVERTVGWHRDQGEQVRGVDRQHQAAEMILAQLFQADHMQTV